MEEGDGAGEKKKSHNAFHRRQRQLRDCLCCSEQQRTHLVPPEPPGLAGLGYLADEETEVQRGPCELLPCRALSNHGVWASRLASGETGPGVGAVDLSHSPTVQETGGHHCGGLKVSVSRGTRALARRGHGFQQTSGGS